MKTASHRNSLQPRVDAERAQQVAHVIPYGLLAQMQLFGNLRGRPPVFQQVQHLGLTRSQVRVPVGPIGDSLPVRHLAEDTDDVTAPHEAHGADFAFESRALGVDEHA